MGKRVSPGAVHIDWNIWTLRAVLARECDDGGGKGRACLQKNPS